ncbi:MAG: nucleotidyltransferase family protein [Acidobacteriota bacterium]|nr:nucleotidyltransferase family protein [Acidobacteriota bacterium]
MIAALVLAAGASSRMGEPKAALPLGSYGHTVLSRGVSTLLSAGLPRIVVVAGAHPGAVRGALGAPDPRVAIIEHREWAAGQLSSMLRGFDALDGPLLEAVLVTLVDVPLVSADTVRTLIHAWRTSRALIVRPARGEVHGHPVVFDRRLFAEFRLADPREGAKPVVRAHAADTLNVPVGDEGAFVDLDVPDDYRRIQALARAREGDGA